MLDREPGGHDRYNHLFDLKHDDQYKSLRVSTSTTDTLIATASK